MDKSREVLLLSYRLESVCKDFDTVVAMKKLGVVSSVLSKDGSNGSIEVTMDVKMRGVVFDFMLDYYNNEKQSIHNKIQNILNE